MNMGVLALMGGIAAGFLGLLLFAFRYDYPVILVLLACLVTVAFAPWHRWF